jgi:predicted TPR repeat methyltransferase
MNPAFSDLEKIHDLHQAGELESAKLLCEAFLEANPDHSEALHTLGLILVEQKNITAALEYLLKATQIDPNPQYQLHLANTFKMAGLYEQAITALNKILQEFPEYPPAYNNLGTLYYAQGKVEEAIRSYQLAISKKNDYVDAYYNLGLACAKKNDIEQALSAFDALLKYEPKHSAALFQLARILMQKDLWDEALSVLKDLASQYPHHIETQINLATCYLKQGVLQLAKEHYLTALTLNPQDIQTLYNLGYIYMQEDNIEQAAHYYQSVIALNPHDFAAHNNLGAIYIFQDKFESALNHFQQALHLQPGNIYLEHIVKILNQDQRVTSSPAAYLQVLFDYYADHYDSHLITNLGYQTSRALLNQMQALQLFSDKKLKILDIGCGTGLCGQVFKPYAERLIGVDLSAAMLKVASVKQIYDELIQDDYLNFLSLKHQAYDLIIAADVLIYTGDLSAILQSAQQALTQGGMFAFNAEISNGPDYRIQPSGRFVHSREYIDKIVKIKGLEVIHYSTASTRTQNYQPVNCHLYILRVV